MKNQIDYLKDLKPYAKFHVNDQHGHKLRAKKYENDSYFVFAKGSRIWGCRCSSAEDVLAHGYVPIIKKVDETEEWHRRIKRALKEMDRTGLWKGSSIEESLQNMLQMTYEDKKKMYELDSENSRYVLGGKKEENPELQKYREKYPFAFNEHGMLSGKYTCEVSECILKPVYFGKYDTERIRGEIAYALQNCSSYDTGRIPDNYDYSFEYKIAEDGMKRAWYSAEYKGCGNGHYYVALSEKVALFIEDD